MTDDPLTFSLIVTRDDVSSEVYQTRVANLYKTFINIGLTALLYQTNKGEDGKERNIILYSIPLVGYSMNLTGNRQLAQDELNNQLIENAKILLEDKMSKRLSALSVQNIYGSVIGVDKETNNYLINKGSTDGLEAGQRLTVLSQENKIIATVTQLDRYQSAIQVENYTPNLIGAEFKARMIKGYSNNTYQVVNFKISSKGANQLFDEKELGAQVSQWFSDFFVERNGLTFLPSKLTGTWVDRSTANAYMVLMKDAKEAFFEVPAAKYPINLDLSGIVSKMIEKNNVNEIWVFGSYLIVDVPNKKYSKEHMNAHAKSLVAGMQTVQERDMVFDQIYNLSAKIASEVNFD
jgi:hypothetical protein